MNYAMFHRMLLVHRETLRTINLGYLSSTGREARFKASDFPNLERLTLSRWQMVDLELSSVVADELISPKLAYFGWDFGIYDQHNEAWTAFGDREEHWLREFARTAVKRKSALREIYVDFNPDFWATSEADGYPWDRMDSIRDEVAPSGLKVAYSRPCVTREAWLEIARHPATPSYEAASTTSDRVSLQMAGSDLQINEYDSEDEVSGTDIDIRNICGYQGQDIREYFGPQR
jgi:hypothetical protein